MIRVQILDKTVCIWPWANVFGKGLYREIVQQTGKPVSEKETSKSEPAVLHLKIDILSYPICGRGVV